MSRKMLSGVQTWSLTGCVDPLAWLAGEFEDMTRDPEQKRDAIGLGLQLVPYLYPKVTDKGASLTFGAVTVEIGGEGDQMVEVIEGKANDDAPKDNAALPLSTASAPGASNREANAGERVASTRGQNVLHGRKDGDPGGNLLPW